ncbi:MAG: excinuclease ABC subunit UvrA [Bacteroidaceae bacterium]
MMMNDCIQIKGARVNNLKDISLEIPRRKLVVVTGLSGSGKSSLAFDTLYAEGQRRYVESLSAYARQFLGRMHKPECDYIKGIPPAIAIEQKVTTRNPRSTVGTSTEIYEYLRLLYARVGKTYSPISGQEVKRHTTEDVVRCVSSHQEGAKFLVLCPITIREGRSLKQQLDIYQQSGFARLEYQGEVTRIEDFATENPNPDNLYLVVDRLSVSQEKDAISRLTDSAETAFYEGGGEMMLRFLPENDIYTFSTRFEADGITFEEPNDNMFSFNSPAGACPDCGGFGKVIGIDEQMVIPNTAMSVYEGAVMCWRGEKMSEWKDWFIRFNSERGFPIFKPYYELTRDEKDWLWHGTFPQSLSEEKKKLFPEEKEWGVVSIDAFFDMLRQGQYKIQNRVMLARYRGKTTCPKCHGTRLKKEANYVKVGDRSITELVDMPIGKLKQWIDNLFLTPEEEGMAHRILTEIRQRLQFLMDVGLEYLTLNRPSASLSGGESQRINLATSLGSSLVGSLYILDEPSIGLHGRDTDRLIKVLKQLRDLGNTVIVVEHDEEIMRAADWIIDIGPDAGRLGGRIMYNGPAQPLPMDYQGGSSHTLDYLTGREQIPIPMSRRPWTSSIIIRGARANNLQGIDVKFPLNVMTCVTGVSGSGKSTLVCNILYRALKRHLNQVSDRPGEHIALEGDMWKVKAVEFVDQNPIGKNSRSNPVTYVKAWDEIRKLYAAQPLSKQMGYTAGYFSFNTEGGRCEECKGEGTVTVEMQFMADLVLPCESCHGKRFKQDTLEVTYEGKNVYDVLEMTVNQAIEFFGEHKQKRIVDLLRPLQNVGLGYIKLGQPSSTLSGGENQRVKLAYYLGMEKHEPTVFIFDEPTTGLHFHDIHRLLDAFNALILRGHTLIIIEHNLDVIKCADHVIDLGPEGGARGGQVLCCGKPEEIIGCEKSYTAQFLKEKLGIKPDSELPQ